MIFEPDGWIRLTWSSQEGHFKQKEKVLIVWGEWSMVCEESSPGDKCGRTGRGWEGRALNTTLSNLCFFLAQVNSNLFKVFQNCSVITKSAIYNSSTVVWIMIDGRGTSCRVIRLEAVIGETWWGPSKENRGEDGCGRCLGGTFGVIFWLLNIRDVIIILLCKSPNSFEAHFFWSFLNEIFLNLPLSVVILVFYVSEYKSILCIRV